MNQQTRYVLYGAVAALLALGVFFLRPGGGESIDSRWAADLEKVESLLDAGDTAGAIAHLDQMEAIGAQVVIRHALSARPGQVESLAKTLLADATTSPVRQMGMTMWVRSGLLDKGEAKAVLASHDDPAVRRVVVRHIGGLDDWELIPLLIESLRDPDRRVRIQADEAIHRIMGVDFHFRVDASRAVREKTIKNIEEFWPAFYEQRKQQQAQSNQEG